MSGSIEERLLHLEDTLRKHICFLIDEGDHKALINLVNHLGAGLNVSNPIYESMWELSELLIDEFGYKKCLSCYWAIGEGERHFSCEEDIAKENAPHCIHCRHPVLEGEDHLLCHQQLEDYDDEHTHPPCSICGSTNCGGNHCNRCGSIDCEGDCCDTCGRSDCNGDCCDRCGSPRGTCQCYEGSPLASEKEEHRTGNFDDLIDLEETEVND